MLEPMCGGTQWTKACLFYKKIYKLLKVIKILLVGLLT